MTEAPLLTRLRAKLAGEIASDSLDAYRAAGAAAYDLFVAAEQHRAAAASSAEEAVSRTFLVCTWNAFVLQTLGDAFIDADYEADPKTVGFVPPVTAEQALAFYAQVEQWLVFGRQAESDSGYRLDAYLPAELPEWVEVEPCPDAHLHAMISACAEVVEHAELAVTDLEKTASAEAKAVARIRAELAAVKASAEYAVQLHTQYHQGSGSPQLHERIETSIKGTVEKAYALGQLAAMPELTDQVPSSDALRGKRLPGPGEPGFDPWCLTDPDTREQWQRDRQARRAIQALWANDPEPRATLDMQAEIEAALGNGSVVYATAGRGRRLGNYFCCPWAPIYAAERPITIAGRRLRPLQQFTLDVSAEELAEGGPFKRELLLGNFHPTSTIDYCDPSSGGHQD